MNKWDGDHQPATGSENRELYNSNCKQAERKGIVAVAVARSERKEAGVIFWIGWEDLGRGRSQGFLNAIMVSRREITVRLLVFC
ncbi:hypothetical protein MLD38_019350 [Melastoma candidum]|uniref:Uncharacterized protein n=1 Tax=Melastoma candidum TaxID=119954 RepID=A0ACB9R4Z5_9MYRT|nr:hypothetical protein MLD38_019350 [Melastoma candidum]